MKSTSNHKYFKTYLLLTLFIFPFSASASVQITEIMYDLPGADTGREWVEVTNTGSEPVDLTGYRLTEGGTNHTLTVVSGSMTLAPGASAVIADNKDKFLIDWPQFSGTLFDSAFSLKNATDTVEFKDKELNALDIVSYDKSGGANGDGNTFHRVDATLVAGAPNPGSWNNSAPAPAPEPEPEPEPEPTQSPAPTATSSASTTQSAPATSATSQPLPTQETEEEIDEQKEKETEEESPAPAAALEPTSAKSVASNQPTKTTSKSKTIAQTRYADPQPAAAAYGAESSSTSRNSFWLYVLGLVALLALSTSAVLYARLLNHSKASETSAKANEFEIEG